MFIQFYYKDKQSIRDRNYESKQTSIPVAYMIGLNTDRHHVINMTEMTMTGQYR